MTMCRAFMDVQQFYGELPVNLWTRCSDHSHVGELRFMITEECGMESRLKEKVPHLLSAFLLSVWARKRAAKGPFEVHLLLCHVRGRCAISAFTLPPVPSSSL